MDSRDDSGLVPQGIEIQRRGYGGAKFVFGEKLPR